MQIKPKLVGIVMMMLLMKDHNNVTADIMSYLRKRIWMSVLLVIAAMTVACGQVTTGKLSKDQKQILNLYAKDYLIGDCQYLFFKTVAKKDLIKALNPPLKVQDFKLPEVALRPDEKQAKLDTLFNESELDSWNEDIKAYKRFKWKGELFSSNVKIIPEKKIPAYLSHTDIPPPRQDPVFIHYISIPFVFKGKSALLYSKKWSSGANTHVLFLYFVKKRGAWHLAQKGVLNVNY